MQISSTRTTPRHTPVGVRPTPKDDARKSDSSSDLVECDFRCEDRMDYLASSVIAGITGTVGLAVGATAGVYPAIAGALMGASAGYTGSIVFGGVSENNMGCVFSAMITGVTGLALLGHYYQFVR